MYQSTASDKTPDSIQHINRFCWLLATVHSCTDQESEISMIVEITSYMDKYVIPLLPTTINSCNKMCTLIQMEYTWLIIFFDTLSQYVHAHGSSTSSMPLSSAKLTMLLQQYNTILLRNLEFIILGLLQNLNVKNINTKILSATVCCLCYVIHYHELAASISTSATK